MDPEFSFEHFPAGSKRHCLDEMHVPRVLVAREMLLRPGDDRFVRNVDSLVGADDHGNDFFAVGFVWDADNRHLFDSRVAH